MADADAKGNGDRDKRDQIGARIERLGAFGGAHRLLWDRLAGDGIAGNDVDADIAGPAHEIVHDRAVQHFEPSRTCRFPDDDLRDVV